MYVKRSGGQEQLSAPLRFPTQSLDSFSDLIAWSCTQLDRDLSTDVLAARARLSVRHFNRRFTAAVGRSPAEFVESARLCEARERLLDTRKRIEASASSLVFRSADVFCRRFEPTFVQFYPTLVSISTAKGTLAPGYKP